MLRKSISYILILVLIFTQIFGYPIQIPFLSGENEVYALGDTELPIKYDDFSNAERLQFNGNASQSASSIIVSPSVKDNKGTIFSKQAVNLKNGNSFSTYFSFRLTEKYDWNGSKNGKGGDGFTFALQPMSSSTIGFIGSNEMGLKGVRTSAAIEFDTYYNDTANDPYYNFSHIGVNISGSAVSLTTKEVSGFNEGTAYHVWIDYDGTNNTVEVRLATSDTRPSTPTLTYSNFDLQSKFGDVPLYAGFSAASGSARQNHIIDKWYFDNEYNPIDVATAYTEAALLLASSIQYADRTEITFTVTDHNGDPVQNTALNVSADNGVLSSTIGTTDSNGQVILDLTDTTNNEVTITAETQTGIELEKTIVLDTSLTDSEIVQLDYDGLTVNDILNGNTSKDSILTDLCFPEAGDTGSIITWNSSDTSIISVDGAVTRPEYVLGDQKVTLTAIISKGEESAEKFFNLTVKCLDIDAKDALEADFSWLTAEQILNGNISMDDILSSLTFPTIAPKGSDIIWNSSNASYIGNDGTVSRPSYIQGNQVVEVSAVIKNESLEKTKYFSFNVKKDLPTDADILSEDKKWLYSEDRLGDDSLYNHINSSILRENDSQFNLINDLDLPPNAPNGSTIVWTSSDTGVISNSGDVIRPDNDEGSKQVTLTADISSGAESESIEFDFTVLPLPDYQAPVMISSIPEEKVILSELNKIILTFDEPIQSNNLNAITYFKKTDAGYTQPVFGVARIIGNNLEMDVIGEADDYDLQINIPADTIEDFSGNHYGSLIQKEYYYRAKRPELTSANPVNKSKNIPVSVPISFTFDENITVNASKINLAKEITEKTFFGGSRNIKLSVGFQTDVAGNVLDIIPTEPLRENTKYIITIKSDAVKNQASKTLSKAINTAFFTVNVTGRPKVTSYDFETFGRTPILIEFDKQIRVDLSKILNGHRRAECYYDGNKLYLLPRGDNRFTFKEGAVTSMAGEEAEFPSDKFWRKVETGFWFTKEVSYEFYVQAAGYGATSIGPETGRYIALDGSIVLVYPMGIVTGESAGSISLTNSRGQNVPINKTVSGNRLLIKPEGEWLPYVSYYLSVPKGAVQYRGIQSSPLHTYVKVPDKLYTENTGFDVSKDRVFETKPVSISAENLKNFFAALGRNLRSHSFKIDGREISNDITTTYTPDTSASGKRQVKLDVVDSYGYSYSFTRTIDVLKFLKYNTQGNVPKPEQESLYNHTEIEDEYATSITLQNRGIVLDNEEVTAKIGKRTYYILDLFITTIKIPTGYDTVISQTQRTDNTGTAQFKFDIDSLESGEYNVSYSAPCAGSLPEHYLKIKKLSDMASIKINLVDKNTDEVVASDQEIQVVINGEVYKASKNSDDQYIIEDLLPLMSTIKVSHSYYYDETIEEDLWTFENEITIPIERDIPSDKPIIRYISSSQTNSRNSEKKIFISGAHNTLTFDTHYDWKGHEPGQFEFIASIPDRNGNITEKKFYSKDGKLKINVGKDLGPSATMIVRAVSKDGSVSASHDLGFEVAPNFPVGSVIQKNGKYLVNLSMNLSDIGGVTIPEGFPLVGGDDLELDLETLRFGGIMTDDGSITFNFGYTPGILEQISDSGNIAGNFKELNDMRKGGKYKSGDKDFGMSLDGKVKWKYKADENAWYFRHGEVEVRVEGEISYTQYFWLFVVPAYFRGTLSAEVAATLQVDRPHNTYDFSGTLGIEPGVEIALGAGVEGLNLEGFLGGYIGTEFAFPSCDIAAEGTVEGGARATILFWSWEKKAIEYTFDIYRSASLMPNAMTMEGMLLGANVLAANESEERYSFNKENFTLMGRNNGSDSKWVANSPVVMGFSGTPSDITRKVLKSNIFPNAEPKLVSLNGNATLIWADDNPERTSQNRTEIYYSQYNGGLWSDPQAFGIDGTADFAVDASVRTIGAIGTETRTYGAITAWTDMNKIFGEDATMEDNFAAGEITTAILENVSIKEKATLTNDDYYDYMAQVTETEEKDMIVWVKNRSNTILSPDSETYDLYYSINTGTGWEAPLLIEGNLDPIVQLNAESNGEKTVAVYTIDTDCNILTDADREVYAAVYQDGAWAEPVRLTDNTLSDGNPRVAFDNDGEMIYWLQDGQIYYKKGINGQSEMLNEGVEDMVTSFEIAQNNDGLIALTYATTGLDGIKNLSLLLYDIHKQSVSYPSTLISGKNSYSQLTPDFTDNDEIMIALTETNMITETIDGEEYRNVGETDLVVIRKQLIHDLKVGADDIEISTGNGAADSTNRVSVTIHNEGDYPESNVEFRFTDTNGNPVSQIFTADTIPANDYVTTEVEWIVPEDYQDDTAVVIIDPDRKIQDIDRNNNTSGFALIEYELFVENLEAVKKGNNTYSITAEVFNPTGKIMSDCELSLYHEGLSGSLILSYPAGDVESGESRLFSFELDASTLFKSYEKLQVMAAAHNASAQAKEENGYWFELKPEGLKVMAAFPGNESFNVPLNQTIELQFNKEIRSGTKINDIELYDMEGTDHPVNTSLEGSILKITPQSDLSGGTMYTLSVPANAVETTYGSTLSEDYFMKLITVDTDSLGVTGSYPTQGMTGVEQDDSIMVNFTNDIKEGDQFGQIKVLDQNQREASIEKQISGSALRITPRSEWRGNSTYTVEIPEVSLYDISNKPLENYYAITFDTKAVQTDGGSHRPRVKEDTAEEITLNIISDSYMIISASGNDYELTKDQIDEAMDGGNGIRIEFAAGQILLPNEYIKKYCMNAQKIQMSVEEQTFSNSDTPQDKTIVSGGYGYTLMVDGEPMSNTEEKIYIEIPINTDKINDPERAVAYYQNEKGEWIPSGGVYDEQTGTFRVRTDRFGTFIVLEGNKSFADVVHEWAKKAVEILASREVIKGKRENLFDPESSITRAEFTALIIRALYEGQSPYSDDFRDIQGAAWYADEVQRAVELSLVSGMGDGSFAPDAQITREQICTILYRVADRFGNIRGTGGEMGFSDTVQISDYAREAVEALNALGIINGYGHEIRPQNNATREEAAVMLYRLLSAIQQI